MDSDKLFIPDKWIHQFVLKTRQYLFSDEDTERLEREVGAAAGDSPAADAGAETGSYDV